MTEPPPSQGDLHFSLFGIPVRVHPFFWLAGVLLIGRWLLDAPDFRAALFIFLPWITAMFFSILVHELGHAAVMRVYGFRPWITLHGFGGLASYDPAGSYESRGADTTGQVLISLAGPGAGFLLAGVVVLGIELAGHDVVLYWGDGLLPMLTPAETVGTDLLTNFLFFVLQICVLWGVLNLTPIYPLDGGQIAREVLLRVNPHDGIRQSLWLSVVTGALLAILAIATEGVDGLFMAFLFGYLSYASYQTLQQYSAPGDWR